VWTGASESAVADERSPRSTINSPLSILSIHKRWRGGQGGEVSLFLKFKLPKPQKNIIIKPMKNTTFVVFDVETTGFEYTKGERITEIGAVKIINGQVTEHTFESLVNPGKPISEECVKITGITDEKVKNAPTIGEVMEKFIQFAENSILVAHNASFDISFLKPEWEQASPFTPFPTIICSKEMDKIFYPEDRFHNLDIVCARWGVNLPTDRHRALADTIATAHCVAKMLAQPKMPNLDDLVKKVSVK
jgi:DNA polymerase-3 subunit alpha (Gram-positive type)